MKTATGEYKRPVQKLVMIVEDSVFLGSGCLRQASEDKVI